MHALAYRHAHTFTQIRSTALVIWHRPQVGSKLDRILPKAGVNIWDFMQTEHVYIWKGYIFSNKIGFLMFYLTCLVPNFKMFWCSFPKFSKVSFHNLNFITFFFRFFSLNYFLSFWQTVRWIFLKTKILIYLKTPKQRNKRSLLKDHWGSPVCSRHVLLLGGICNSPLQLQRHY